MLTTLLNCLNQESGLASCTFVFVLIEQHPTSDANGTASAFITSTLPNVQPQQVTPLSPQDCRTTFTTPKTDPRKLIYAIHSARNFVPTQTMSSPRSSSCAHRLSKRSTTIYPSDWRCQTSGARKGWSAGCSFRAETIDIQKTKIASRRAHPSQGVRSGACNQSFRFRTPYADATRHSVRKLKITGIVERDSVFFLSCLIRGRRKHWRNIPFYCNAVFGSIIPSTNCFFAFRIFQLDLEPFSRDTSLCGW